jgi:hypothetical protein
VTCFGCSFDRKLNHEKADIKLRQKQRIRTTSENFIMLLILKKEIQYVTDRSAVHKEENKS